MLGTFLALLQLLAPFLKESVFGTATFKEWLKHNFVSCLWILLLMSMLGVVFYLSDQLVLSRHTAMDQTHKLDVLQVQYKELQARSLLLTADLNIERERAGPRDKQIVTLTEDNFVMDGKVHLYESWLDHWGVDKSFHGPGFPPLKVAGTAPAPRPSSSKPKPAPMKAEPPKAAPAVLEPPKKSVLERLKDWGKE
jgi:hypothetical protein